MTAPRRRVVVTGMGVVSPVGTGVPAFWSALLRGESGAAGITAFDPAELTTRFACEVRDFDPLAWMDRKMAQRLDRFVQFAVVAADEAVRDAALDPPSFDRTQQDRAGVIFGSGIGGIRTFQEQAGICFREGPRRLSPFFIPMMIVDMGAGVLAMRYGFRGPNHCVVSACATGNHNIADAAQAIRDGIADVMLTGSSEAAICQLGVGGFGAMRALSTRNDDPAAASRPFDAARDGFVMGEGAGALVLESLEHAQARGARVHAELLGVGTSADAYHMSAPEPEGRGVRLAIARALAESGLTPADVDTINMHATSTPLGDAAECAAIRAVLGERVREVTVTSTKSMTGHMLAAAGSAEAIAAILSIRDGVVPPTINLDELDPACDLSIAANAPVRRRIRVALNDAFGFGGHNTCAVFRAYEP